MDPWKRDALLRLEHDLRMNLNLVDILCRLDQPAGGFMTPEERMSVEAEEGRNEKVGKIIKILQSKGNKEFDVFLKLLKETGNVWASKRGKLAQQFQLEYPSHGKMPCFHCLCAFLYVSCHTHSSMSSSYA